MAAPLTACRCSSGGPLRVAALAFSHCAASFFSLPCERSTCASAPCATSRSAGIGTASTTCTARSSSGRARAPIGPAHKRAASAASGSRTRSQAACFSIRDCRPLMSSRWLHTSINRSTAPRKRASSHSLSVIPVTQMEAPPEVGTAADPAPRKRGRPPKKVVPKDDAAAQDPAPRKRGRPKKAVPEAETTAKDPAPRKRGRPKKNVPEADSTAEAPAPRKRGRPKKGAAAPAAEEEEEVPDN
eukprot:scaffold8988_cov112-Isochrysis_galbana.AAC.4